jgi:hypothetical protein
LGYHRDATSSINLFFSFKYTKMDPIEGTFFSVHSIGSILIASGFFIVEAVCGCS